MNKSAPFQTPDLSRWPRFIHTAGHGWKTSSWLLTIITLLAIIVRLYRLDEQSLWMDEIASLNNARAFAAGGMHALAQADHVAPLHSLILWAAVTVGGDSALTLRLPSALFGVLTVPATYFMAMRLLPSQTAGLVCALLVAVSPYAVWYSQEARMYALLLLCSTMYVAITWPVVDRGLRSAEVAALIVVTTIGLYTHHYMILLSAAFGLFLVFRGGLWQSRAWIWFGTQVLALMLFTFWLHLTADKMGANAGGVKPLLLLWTPYTLFTFVSGLSFGPSVGELRMDGAGAALIRHLLPISLVILASMILIVAGLRRALCADLRTVGIWLIMWLVIPIVLAILATLVTNISYNVRYVIISLPPVLLLLTLAILDVPWGGLSALYRNAFCSRSPNAALRQSAWYATLLSFSLATLAGCIILSLSNWYFNDAYAKEDARPVAQLLTAGLRSDQTLIINNSRIVPILEYYQAHLPAGLLQIDGPDYGRTPSTVLDVLNQITPASSVEIWLIEYRSWETDPTGQVRRGIEEKADRIGEQAWPGVTLLRYRLRS